MKDPIQRMEELHAEMLEAIKQAKNQRCIKMYNAEDVTINETRKLICEFENHKYYEGDTLFYYHKDTFDKKEDELNDDIKGKDFGELNHYSKYFPSAALRDAALEEYKRSKEPPEYVECLERSESSVLCEGFVYKIKDRDKTGYEIFLSYDGMHSGWYDKERFIPSTLAAYERQELLEKAKNNYGAGVKFRDPSSDVVFVSVGDGYEFSGKGNMWVEVEENELVDDFGYIYYDGQWAEIITTPEYNSFEDCLKEYKEKVGNDSLVEYLIRNELPFDMTETDKKVHAIISEIVVSTVLNEEAKESKERWWISFSDHEKFVIREYSYITDSGQPYASRELAERAIKILGEPTIKTARI
jgi:hypothetical protein